MIRITQLKIPVNAGQDKIEKKICSAMHIGRDRLLGWEILRRSVDARKKPDLFYVCTVRARVKGERSVLSGNRSGQIRKDDLTEYRFPEPGNEILQDRPVVIGSGPAGLFCAYMLAEHGYCPVILERGDPAEERRRRVDAFWETGRLDPESNVQFGEGGAGTFSDGKLNTSVKDPLGRIRKILQIFHEAGAPEEILYDARAHLGTDQLVPVLLELRKRITEKGGTYHFRTRCDKLLLENGHVTGVCTSDGHTISANAVVLAVGHSARDTYRMLYDLGISLEEKAFAVGLRAEHPQKMINIRQYGAADAGIGAAPYKLTHTCGNGRGVYSFCMCPGGYVVNASSEPGMTAVNGMSYHDRGGRNANSAIVVTVTPEDFAAAGCGHDVPKPLRGIAFQRELEKKAWKAGEGAVPVQKIGSFLESIEDHFSDRGICRGGQEISAPPDFGPCIKGAFREADVSSILPRDITASLAEGLLAFDRKIPGFATPEAWLSGVESRTSSPVRILRGPDLESSAAGLYPCGEGAGYAGGITSAAADGLRCAEAIAGKYSPLV